MRSAPRVAIVCMLLSLSGCVCGALDPAARFACTTTPECGPDFVCVRGECVSADGGTDAGSTDAGSSDGGTPDAGIDVDGDGFPAGIDCDDQSREVHPGATELCSNGIDDDCDNLRDCEQTSCNGMQCVGAGTCMGGTCIASTEVRCDDGLDNDGDTLIDCVDPDCPMGARCDDANACSTMSACATDGGCVSTQAVTCTTPPTTCYATNGSCQPDSGVCSYTPVTGRCNDGLICTDNESCNNGVCGGGTRRTCGASPNVCFGAGTCTEPAGTCVYTPLANGNCNDNNACTITDRCDGDGGCVGTAINCTPPSQCHQNAGCITTSGCQFTARTGQPCDAGFPTAGTCSAGFVCNPPSAFPYTPSNFSPAMLPPGTANPLNLTCDATLNVSNSNPSFSAPCVSMPPQMVVIGGTGAGVPDIVLVQTGTFTQTAGTTLTITGNKMVIFAVLGNATLGGKIRARNPMAASFCTAGLGADGQLFGDGSGGGGYGANGGNGGLQNAGAPPPGGQLFGTQTITPLVSGCRGGTSASGGAGGGAVQFTVRDDLMVSGTITAPGLGGLTTMSFEPPGGGGSGGSILLEASNLTLTTTSWLTANGGGGAKGQSLSGAGGVSGADGAEASAMPALGGTGTGSGGNGGNGGANTVPATAGFPPGGGGSASAGSGGGAVGRIRLNAYGTCTLAGGVSPAATSNGACP